MGLEETAGVLVDDVKLALDGRVKDGYRVQLLLLADSFFSSSVLNVNCQRTASSTTTPADNRVHVLVCVVPADTGDATKEKILCKIKEIRKEATVRSESLPVRWFQKQTAETSLLRDVNFDSLLSLPVDAAAVVRSRDPALCFLSRQIFHKLSS